MKNSHKKALFISLILFLLFAAFAGGCSKSPASLETGASGAESDPSADKTGNADSETIVNMAEQPAIDPMEETVEAMYYTSVNSGCRAVYNSKSDFWFDIPERWRAVSKETDSDGYYILTDNEKMDIRIYGVMKELEYEPFIKSLSDEKAVVYDVLFVDGASGRKIVNGNSTIYFVRPDGDSYICMYVNYSKQAGWFEKNNDQIEKTAVSIRTRRDINQAEGENKIELDDLKLGLCAINMPYSDFSKFMKYEPLKDETDGVGGRFLFYPDGTEIYLFDDRIVSMNVISSEYETPRGLKPGDSADRVLELYGEPDNKHEDGIWGYNYDGLELLTIVISADKVVQIQIDMTI